MSKIPSDDILECLYKLRIREIWSTQKMYWNCTTWRFIRRYRCPTIRNWRRSRRGVLIRNFDYETLTPRMGELGLEQWWKVERECQALKEEQVSVTSGKKKANVRKETVAVSATKPKIVHTNQNTLPPHFLSQPNHEVEVCRGREVSEAKVTTGPFFDNLAGSVWEVPVSERLVNIGIRPSANCTAGDKCLFPHYKVDGQPKKKPQKRYFPKRRESDDKNAVAIVHIVPQSGCVSQVSEVFVSQRGKQSRGNPMQKVLEPIQRVWFTKFTLRQASIQENKGPSLGQNTSQKSSSAKSLRCEFWGQVPWRKRQGCILLARGRMGTPGCVD